MKRTSSIETVQMARPIMTNDEWTECDDALEMLVSLKETLSAKAFRSLHLTLRSYMLACAERVSHLLPQRTMQMGLNAARQYINGDLDGSVLRWLDYYLEVEVLTFHYHPNSDEVRKLVAQTKELKDLPYEQAVSALHSAAKFGHDAIMGWLPRKRNQTEKASFLCPILLRKFIPAPFDPESLKKATPRPLMTNQEWRECNDILKMFDNLRRLPIAKYKALKLRRTVHRYLIASCDKYMHLLQSPMIQQGLIGAKKHLEEPINPGRLYALWGYAFDEIGEHDSGDETAESRLRYQAQNLALSAINGSWPRDWDQGAELYSPELLRNFLPAPFDR